MWSRTSSRYLILSGEHCCWLTRRRPSEDGHLSKAAKFRALGHVQYAMAIFVKRLAGSVARVGSTPPGLAPQPANTPPVALRHYIDPTDTAYAAAANWVHGDGAESGAPAAQSPAQQAAAGS